MFCASGPPPRVQWVLVQRSCVPFIYPAKDRLLTPPNSSPPKVNASSELMHQLTAAAACLARFQQLTFAEHNTAAQAHALAQAQMQSQNLQPLPPPPELSPGPELPPIRAPPVNESHVLPPPSAVYPGPSRQPSPPRTALHPSRHQPPPLQYHPHHSHHHHQQLSPPPLHVPGSSSDARREFSVLHPSQSETPRQTPVPSSSSASSSTSVSTSPSALHSRQTLNNNRASSSYTGYNEIENAWGYFDSRDLGAGDEEDEEDELLEDERRSRASMHRHNHRNGPLGGHSRHTSSRMSPRTSEVRSTASSSGPEDTPMRMREDSPMRTR